MTTEQVANRLVELCRAGKNLQAVDELYSNDVVSTELMSMPGMPAEMKGIEAVRGKNIWWFENHIIHSTTVSAPVVAQGYFSVAMALDVSSKKDGKRMQMSEICVFEVKDGKICHERFFYAM